MQRKRQETHSEFNNNKHKNTLWEFYLGNRTNFSHSKCSFIYCVASRL